MYMMMFLTKDQNNQSCSRMWDGTISPKGSHFPVRNDTCRVYVERKCKPEAGICGFHAQTSVSLGKLFWIF